MSFDKKADIIAIADIFAYNYEILSIFILDEAIEIALFKVKILENILHNSHKDYSDIICSLLTTLPPSIKTICCLLQKLTGMTHISYQKWLLLLCQILAMS